MDGNDGNSTKIIAMICLGLGSFCMGLLPAVISSRSLRKFPLTTSLMLCFGAGVLLATSLVHMLPDVRTFLPNYAEVIFCMGFFIVYFIDEFIHYFFGEAIQHSHNEPVSTFRNATNQRDEQHSHTVYRRNYGTTNNESESLLQHNQRRASVCSHDSHCDDVIVAESNARICHSSHTKPCIQSKTGTFGLFFALSLHSLIEGLAIGVQDSSTKVIFLLGAIACHKFVMAFCLGLEYRTSPNSTVRSQTLAILIFSMGSMIGIAIGMLIADVPSNLKSTAFPIIQALAGGTLFYVTVCEVIPREKAQWHQNQEQKFAGFAQFFAVVIGFVLISLITYFVDVK